MGEIGGRRGVVCVASGAPGPPPPNSSCGNITESSGRGSYAAESSPISSPFMIAPGSRLAAQGSPCPHARGQGKVQLASSAQCCSLPEAATVARRHASLFCERFFRDRVIPNVTVARWYVKQDGVPRRSFLSFSYLCARRGGGWCRCLPSMPVRNT